MYTYEKGQKQPSSHSYTELSKTQFSPVSIEKDLTHIIIFMKSTIQFFINSIHVLTLVYKQEKSKKLYLTKTIKTKHYLSIIYLDICVIQCLISFLIGRIFKQLTNEKPKSITQ